MGLLIFRQVDQIRIIIHNVQITAVLFAFVTLASAITLVVRFFSQDWAGAKIRYEERRMQDEEGKRRG